MPVSVPCRINGNRDQPIMIKGRIPYFSSYGLAYDFLARRGFSIDHTNGGDLGVVYECPNLERAVDAFGAALIPYASLSGSED